MSVEDPGAADFRAQPLAEVARFLFAAQAGILSYWALFALELLVAGGITALALWGLADLLAEFSPGTQRLIRAAYLIGAFLAAASLLAVVVRQARRRSELALWMEAREPAFDGHLLAAAEALESPARVPPAVAVIAAERALEILKVTGARPIHPRLPWTLAHFWLLGAMAVTLLAALSFGPAFFQAFVRGLFPASAVEAVLAIRFLEVQPGQAQSIAGDALPVEALLSGTRAGAVYVQVRALQDEAGPAPVEHALFPVPEAQAGDRWRGSLGVLHKDSVYRLVAYDAADLGVRRHPRVYSTEWYPVCVRPRAGLREFSVWVEAPGYTGYRPYGRSHPTSVQALAQSEITVLLGAAPAGDLGTGHAELPGGRPAALDRLYEKEGLAYYRMRFTAERSGILRLQLGPAEESRTGVRTALAVIVVQDLAPEADAVIPADALPGPGGLPVDLRVNDDIGLTSARLILRPLPPEEGADPSEVVREIAYEIPLPQKSRREVHERWILPAQGLEAWLAAGFLYQVEAMDGAAPIAQTGRSLLRRWDPKRAGRPHTEQAGLLEAPPKHSTRSLTRPNAFGKIPNPNPNELAQLGDPGAGTRPKQLQRPNAERLDSGGKSSAGAGSAGAGAQASGAKKSSGAGSANKPQDGYENAQALPRAEKPEPPTPHAGEGQATPGPDGKESSKPEDSAGKRPPEGERKTEEPGAKGKAGRGGTGATDGSSGGPGEEEKRAESGSSSQGDPGAGSPSQAGSADEGAGTGPGTQPGTGGAGGQTPRDGGLKSGKEVGTGSGKMAPPDLQTLARMKGLSTEEARRYLEQKGIGLVRTDFGKASPIGGRLSDVQPANASARLFAMATPTVPKKGGLGSTSPLPGGSPQARLSTIDPLYYPIVEGYFKRMGRKAGTGKP